MSPGKPSLVKPSADQTSSQNRIASGSDVGDGIAADSTLSAWMEDSRLSLYVLMAITGGVLYVTYLIFRPFLTSLFLALVMAVAFYPVHKWFNHRLRSEYLAALGTTIMALILIVVPFILISARLAGEATTVYGYVLQILRDPRLWPRPINPLLEKTAEITGVPISKLTVDLSVHARQLASWLLRVAASLGRHFGQQMWTIALALILLVPLLRHSGEFRSGAHSLLPLSRQRAQELGTAIYEGILADIYGVVAVGIAEGGLIAVGFWFTGISSPLFWGVVAIVLSCLPFFGVSLVWIPAFLVLAMRGQWTNAVLLLVWSLLVVSTADGILRSRVVSRRTRMNSMLIALSIMGGVATFGAVGIFVGPVVLVLVGTLLRILREEHASMCQSRLRVIS